MAFTAVCPFCRVQVRNVPQDRIGASTDCPRCHNPFTLAPLIGARPSAQPHVASLATPIVATAPSSPTQTAPVPPPPRPESAPHWPKEPLLTPPEKAALSPGKMLWPSEADLKPRLARQHKNALGIVAFFLGSAALLAASLPALGMLTLPLGGVGVLLGIAGLCSQSAKGRGLIWPVAGLVVSLAVVILVSFWPTLLGLTPRGSAKEMVGGAQLTVIPRSTQDAREARPATSSDWVDATGQAVHKNDLRLVVLSATVKSLSYKDDKGKQVTTKEKYLFLELRLSNVAINHTIEYVSWGEVDSAKADRRPRLQDNLDKTYALKTLPPGVKLAGHVPRATIGPWKAVKDVLIFEAPASDMNYLHLELPCSAFGAPDTFRLEIPRRWLVYQ